MDNIAEQTSNIVRDCLYKPEELLNGGAPPDAIIVEGIMGKFAFHPDRVHKNKSKVAEILREMPDTFFPETGGGWSFLQLCQDKHGHQWGEHRNCEELVVLAIACGYGKFLMPRDMWGILPGGMPYVGFDIKEPEQSEAA